MLLEKDVSVGPSKYDGEYLDPAKLYKVVGKVINNSRVISYVVSCNQCKKDKELNGDGLFTTSLGNLKSGQLPCCCSTSSLKTKDQWEVLYTRALKELSLSFMGWHFYRGKTSKALFKCETCSLDPEMYGDGIFPTGTYDSLAKGRVSCGCRPTGFNHNKEQIIVRLRRLLQDTNYSVVEESIPLDVKTKSIIQLSCGQHGVFTKALNNVLYNESGCQQCANENASERMKGVAPTSAIDSKRKSDEYFIKKFENTEAFPKGTVFRKLNTTKWEVYCPICDVKNDCWVSSLERGILSCKCMRGIRYTLEERTTQLQEECTNRGYQFAGWKIDGEVAAYNKIKVLCEDHGEFYPSVTNFLKGRGCPSCSGKNQQECYINIVKDGDLPIAIKFGIARNSLRREVAQNKKSVYNVQNYAVWCFPDVFSCKDSERICKQTLVCGILPKSEMPDGYSETTSALNLEKIIEIYEENGGVRK